LKTSRLARTLGLAAALAMAAPGGPALAARPGDADADGYSAALTRAIAAKERALDVNEPPRWEETLRLFQEAAALRATRECAYEIGVAAERLSRHDLAVEGYETALDLGLAGPPRARAQTFVAAHAAVMARLDIRGPAGRIIYVAGVQRGRLPLQRPLVLFPGEARLEVIDAAGASTSVTVYLRSGQREAIDLDRPPASATPPAPPSARSGPPPQAAAPETPPASEPVTNAPPAGDAGAHAAERAVDVPTRGWWIAGVGAAVTVAAVVMLPVSSARLDTQRAALADKCVDMLKNDTCTAMIGEGPAAQSLSDSIATWKAIRTGAKVGIGVGAALVAGGLLLRYRDGAAAPRAALVFDPAGGGMQVGMVWTGRF